jgi:prepilin-type N-terminal cleavage/methylation domain-containing protein
MSASGCEARQRGVTMVELMMVIVIIGIAAGLSFSALKSDQAGADARRVAGFMATAYRLAVGGGAVRPDVVTGPCATTARTRVTISTTSQVNQVAVWKLVEDNLPANTCAWVYVTGIYLSDDVHVFAIVSSAVLAPTGSNPASPLTDSDVINELYYPDGTADAYTVFIENKSGNGTRYRVVGLPLAPAPQIFIDW